MGYMCVYYISTYTHSHTRTDKHTLGLHVRLYNTHEEMTIKDIL